MRCRVGVCRGCDHGSGCAWKLDMSAECRRERVSSPSSSSTMRSMAYAVVPERASAACSAGSDWEAVGWSGGTGFRDTMAYRLLLRRGGGWGVSCGVSARKRSSACDDVRAGSTTASLWSVRGGGVDVAAICLLRRLRTRSDNERERPTSAVAFAARGGFEDPCVELDVV